MRTLLHRFDHHTTAIIQQRSPNWVAPIMKAATFLAHPVLIVGIAGILIVLGLNDMSLFELSGWTILGTLGVGMALKLILRRQRPLTYDAKRWFVTFSFPSGHTVGATVTYGVLALIGSSLLSSVTATFVLIALSSLIVLVGISRVYLGAHYPSDVVVGWIVGLAGITCVLLSSAIL